MNIEPSKILKMKISHRYSFDIFFSHLDSFIVDFENKKAYYDSDLLDMDKHNEFKKFTIKKYPIIKHLMDNLTENIFLLKDENIKNFFVDFNKLKIYDELERVNGDYLRGISFSDNVTVIFYFKDSIKKFEIIFEFPRIWKDFALILKNLVGFDVLNMSFSKYFVNNINYKVTSERIYGLETENKLTLEKFKFTFAVTVCLELFYFTLDFNEKLLKIERPYPGSGFEDEFMLTKKVPDDVLHKFIELLEKHKIYLWSTKDFWKYALSHDDCLFYNFDGFEWGISLTFTNNVILYIDVYDIFPDNYLEFAEDVKKLFGQDFLKSEECKSTIKHFLKKKSLRDS